MHFGSAVIFVVNIECNAKGSVFVWKRNRLCFCSTVDFKRYSCLIYLYILIDIFVAEWWTRWCAVICIIAVLIGRSIGRFNFVGFLYFSDYKSLFRLDCVAVIVIWSNAIHWSSFRNCFGVGRWFGVAFCSSFFCCRFRVRIINRTCCTAYCYSTVIGWNALVFFCEPVVIWAEIAVLKSVEVVGTITLFKLDAVKPCCTGCISYQSINTDWRCCTRHICCYADSLPIKCACKSDTVDFFYRLSWWIKTLNF